MKTILYFLLFLFCSQLLTAQQTVFDDSGKKDLSLTATLYPWDDPKLTNEQKQQMINADRSNPVKITHTLSIDPKDKDKMPVNGNTQIIWKANPLPELESRTTGTESKQNQQAASFVQDQPAGEKSEHVTNYRSMKGLQEQPTGTKALKVTDYRSMKGDNSQPKGNPSGK